MGQEENQSGCNKQLLNPEIIKKHITNVDEENLYELSLQLYEFTKLILEQIKDEFKFTDRKQFFDFVYCVCGMVI